MCTPDTAERVRLAGGIGHADGIRWEDFQPVEIAPRGPIPSGPPAEDGQPDDQEEADKCEAGRRAAVDQARAISTATIGTDTR